MHQAIVAPVVALVCWTLLMQVWLVATRMPALKAKGIALKGLRGGTGRQLDGVLPDSVQWKAHNYNHLLEQPTIFYAIALALAVLNAGDGLNALLAWLYVGLRIVHSLIQATVNIVTYRFLAFFLSTLALLGLAISAAVTLAG